MIYTRLRRGYKPHLLKHIIEQTELGGRLALIFQFINSVDLMYWLPLEDFSGLTKLTNFHVSRGGAIKDGSLLQVNKIQAFSL